MLLLFGLRCADQTVGSCTVPPCAGLGTGNDLGTPFRYRGYGCGRRRRTTFAILLAHPVLCCEHSILDYSPHFHGHFSYDGGAPTAPKYPASTSDVERSARVTIKSFSRMTTFLISQDDKNKEYHFCFKINLFHDKIICRKDVHFVVTGLFSA